MDFTVSRQISPCILIPDSAWVSQQARNFVMEAEDLKLASKYVMRDNDTKFTAQFDAAIELTWAKINRKTRDIVESRVWVKGKKRRRILQ